MYESLCTMEAKINQLDVHLHMLPNFRESILLRGDDFTIYTSTGKLVELEKAGLQSYELIVQENEQWVLVFSETDIQACQVYVLPSTTYIQSALRRGFNQRLNKLLKEFREKYEKEKEEEIRLYFYNSKSNKLNLFFDPKVCIGKCSEYKYHLNSDLPRGTHTSIIDPKYTKPETNCFILGTVSKTNGLKNSMLLDFIKPLYVFDLDFNDEDCTCSEYEEQVNDLGGIILELLEYSIWNGPSEQSRMKSFKQNVTEINRVFSLENVSKIRKLYESLRNN